MKVQLLNIFGDDEMVATSARVSFQKEASDYTESQNEKLINFLARESHWSPFSHPQLQFRIEIPIYVERQIIKTQTGVTYNSISGRYVDFSDSYTLIPEGEWRLQSKDSKQGSSGLANPSAQIICDKIQQQIYNECTSAYKQLMDLGVSKEQARTILPLNLNTTQIWTGSLLAFIRLYNQRIKPDAQKETRDVVIEMMKQLKEADKFKYSLNAYNL